MSWDIFKIILVFLLAVFFLGRRISLNIVMPAASILLGILFLMPPGDFLKAYGLSVISPATIELVATLYLIMLLEEVMRKRGYMQRMLAAMDALFHSKRLDISLLPMLIGFLPSAGGALFSAPIVAQAAEDTPLSAEEKAFMNNLYRHIMETFFPTYPCIILASELSGLPYYRLLPALFPIAVIAFALGFICLRKIPRQAAAGSTASRGKLALALLLALWPLLAMIVLIMLRLPVWLAAGLVWLALVLVERIPWRELPRLLKESSNWKMMLMVVVVMAFKDILHACGALEILPAAIAALPIPGFLIFALLAFLTGLMTGMAVAPVGITLPLALAGLSGDPLPIVVLVVVSSHVGNQLTPMHLCITLTAEHFKANLRKVILRSLPTYLTIWCVGIGLYLLLRI